MADMLTDEQAKEIEAKGLPLPRGSGRNPTPRERDVADLLGRLAEAGGKIENLNPTDQHNYVIYRDRGELPHEKQESARDMMARGFKEAEDKCMDDTTEAMKELEAIAQEALKARRKVEWSDFRSKRAAAATVKELEAKFEATAKKIREEHIGHVTTREFRELAHGHINQLKQCFAEPFQEVK